MNHKFVEFIPDNLDKDTIYISINYSTVVHKCCCGCGKEVVTPLSPTDWELTFDGDSISLFPSIGNWNFECKSHYWINNGKIEWARTWSEEEINAVRQQSLIEKKNYYRDKAASRNILNDQLEVKLSFWSRLKHWLNK